MSPAGHWPQLRAAIDAGADAVYFGLRHFSARAKVGFTLDELPDAVATLHGRGVRAFVTFNTLVFEHELRAAERALTAIAAAGADAVIVQDVGIARLARDVAPGVAVHGSTQMSVTSAQGVAFAAAHGARRVVLGRELSIADLRRIREATDVELEVFVHGALCVSYSGQCFSSEAWGGRSANRGQCAQACRLAYDLLVDGRRQELLDERYLLSPGDLMALAQVPELMAIGIDAFKIEGRYKDAEYVALTTHAYRAAIDAAWAGRPAEPAADLVRDLEQVYSRGLGPWFVAGTDHQTVVRGRAPRHRGMRLGTVVAVDAADGAVVVAPHPAAEPPGPALADPSAAGREAAESTGRAPRPGDGLVFDAAHRRSPGLPEEGGRVYTVSGERRGWRLAFGHDDLDLRRIRPGDAVWRTDDPSLPARVKRRVQASPRRTLGLSLALSAHEGAPLTAVATSERGERSAWTADRPLARAEARPLDLAVARAQLGRLGGTPFHLADVTLDVEGSPFVPVSLLNACRRALVERLVTPSSAPARQSGGATGDTDDAGADDAAAGVSGSLAAPEPVASDAPARLHVLVRTPEQLQAVLDAHAAGARLESVTLDYLELYGLRPSVERVRAAGLRVRVASPRILKPAEQNVVRFLLDLGAEVLVRSAGLLRDLTVEPVGARPRITGDFSLNAANALSARAFLDAGCDALVPTFDLDAAQVAALADAVDPRRLEVVVHHHLPVFHTEHCVFCRFLSSGKDHTDCGHPCERHRLALRDAQGRAHPVLADVGCRNTVFGAEAQSAARHWPRWRAAGLRDARLEFVHAGPDEVRAVVRAWRDALDGSLDPDVLEAKLRAAVPPGVTEGSYYVPREGLQELPVL
jgi:U32 family peptidase